MKKLSIYILSLTLVAFAAIKPAMATDEDMVMNAFEESLLEENFNPKLYLEIVDEDDVELLSQESLKLENHILDIENQINSEISNIAHIETELKTLQVNDADLEKYISTQKIDVAEKEVYKGVSYDKDIYDHGKELFELDVVNIQ